MLKSVMAYVNQLNPNYCHLVDSVIEPSLIKPAFLYLYKNTSEKILIFKRLFTCIITIWVMLDRKMACLKQGQKY